MTEVYLFDDLECIDNPTVQRNRDFLREESVLMVHSDHEQCSLFIAQMLKQAGVSIPASNESSVVNKLRKPQSVTNLNDYNCNGVNGTEDDNNNKLTYSIPTTSSSLGTIQLVNNQLKDVNVLFHNILFPRLNYLNLSFNSIREISPTGVSLSFANVVLLDISHNRIGSLEFASSLNKLEILRCHHNQIDSLSPLQYLSNIEELWVSNNKLEWTQFMFLSTHGKLKRLIKVGNPGDEKAKINEFLVTIVPSLVIIDQDSADKYRTSKAVVTSESNLNDNSDNNAIQNSKIGTDVRVMITQAKVVLKKSSDDAELMVEDQKRGKTSGTKSAQRQVQLMKSPSKKSIKNESNSNNSDEVAEPTKQPTKPVARIKKSEGSGKNLTSLNADLDNMLEGIKNLNANLHQQT